MIMDKFPNYSAAELRGLSHIAVQVLSDAVSAPVDIVDTSPLSAARQVLPDVQKTLGTGVDVGSLQQLVSNEQTSSELAKLIIAELRNDPYLVARINEAYNQQQSKMTVAPDSLAAAALLILAVRITNFEWTPSNVKLQFAKSGNALMGAVATLLKKIGV